jgi:hypothetical protein
MGAGGALNTEKRSFFAQTYIVLLIPLSVGKYVDKYACFPPLSLESEIKKRSY